MIFGNNDFQGFLLSLNSYGGSYRPTDMGTGDSHKVIVTECTANTEKLSDCNIQYVQQGTVSSGALKIMCHERNYTGKVILILKRNYT